MDGSVFAPISSRQSMNMLGFMMQTCGGHGRVAGMLRKPFLLAYKPYYKIWSAELGKDIHRTPLDAVVAVFGEDAVREFYEGEMPKFNYEWYARAVPIIVLHNIHILAKNKLKKRIRKSSLQRRMMDIGVRATHFDDEDGGVITDIFSGDDYVGY